jgi:cephalosporin-C deacetylase-like acetyl esterase
MRLKRMGHLKPSKDMIAQASWKTAPPTFDEFWDEIISDISKLSDDYRLAFHFTDSRLSNNKTEVLADDSKAGSN